MQSERACTQRMGRQLPKVILLTAAMMIGMAGLAGASENGGGTQTSWAAWSAQVHPIEVHLGAIMGEMVRLPAHATAAWTKDLLAEVDEDVTFASAADSPSAQLNAGILRFTKNDATGAAWGLLCAATDPTGAPSQDCNTWNRLLTKSNKYLTILLKEQNQVQQ